MAAYFVGYVPPVGNGEPRADLAAARYALRMMAAGWGPAAEELALPEPTHWPPPLGVATFLLVGLTAVRLLHAAREPRDRLAALGLLAVLTGLVALAAGIAYGRAAISGGAVVNRYVTLMVPALCACHLAWTRFGPPRAAEAVTHGMLVAAVALAWPNAQAGLTAARHRHAIHTMIERDVYRGLPASALGEHYGWFLFPVEPGRVPPALEALRDRGVSPFHRLAVEPRLKDLPVAWRVEGFPAAGPDGWYRADDLRTVVLTVAAPAPVRTTGVRVRYSLTGDGGVVSAAAYWRWPRGNGEEWLMTLPQLLEVGEGREKRVWFGEGTTRLTVVVHGPAAIRIEAVTPFAGE